MRNPQWVEWQVPLRCDTFVKRNQNEDWVITIDQRKWGLYIDTIASSKVMMVKSLR